MYQTVIDFFNLSLTPDNTNPARNIYFNASRVNVLEGYEDSGGWILQKLDADRSLIISILAMPGRNSKAHVFQSLDAVYHEFEKRNLPFGFIVTK